MQELHEIANKMVARGKGLLAADESTPTANKRLKSIDAPEDEEHRRQYRELFINTNGIENHISGIILYDETMWQADNGKKAFLEILKEKNIIIGIKVDQGKDPDEHSESETTTKGLDGLADRLRGYREHGARFAKWRAVIKIDGDLPTDHNIKEECVQLAKYAQICQEAGIVPVVEPEVLRDGAHSIEKTEEIVTKTLKVLFFELMKLNIDLQGVILKTSMVIAGSENDKASPEDVAIATVRALKASVPDELAGVVFLSGGQEAIEATENLNAINLLQPLPWKTTFSYARALQGPALKIWNGHSENIVAARKVFSHRMKMNTAATNGEYNSDME